MHFRYLSFVALLVVPAFARAWGGDGHQLTCLIAEDHLTPAAQAGIRQLIGSAYISDAENANWADEIRRDRTETGPWHFVDIPIDAAGFDEKRDGQDGNNVIDKITFFENVLKDKSVSKSDRVEALKFVVHLVGDVHQPLHCAERNKDKGGNLRLVFMPGQPMATNLHSVWDSGILERHMGKARNLDYSDKLNAAITPQQAKQWARGTPTDWAKASKKMMDERHRSTMEYEWGLKDPRYHANAVPYFENNGIDQKLAPAAGYFADEWHARVSDSTAFCKSYNDFIVWNLDQFTKQTGMDGWYVDNVRPVACDNIDAGRGYRLPDGRVQPTYQMFDTREQFLRVRAMFQDNGKADKFVLHMTNHMIMPWIGAADLALDGEDHVTFPDMHKDFIDFWSLARLRLDYQQCQGTPVTFLQEFQGNWETPDLQRVMRSYTAMTILNDVLPGANPNGQNNAVWAGRNRFGIDANDVTFVPYWTKDSGIDLGGDSLYASSWRRPGSVMIAIVNTGAIDAVANLKLDAAKLGVTDADLQHATDADTGEPVSLAVPVKRHDYRQVMIGTPVSR